MGGKIKVIYFSSIQLILFVYAGFGEKLSTYSLNKTFCADSLLSLFIKI